MKQTIIDCIVSCPPAVYQPSRRIRIGLHIFSAVMFLASAGATVGAFRNIIESWKDYHLSF